MTPLWLDQRHLQPELMDQPDLEPDKHRVALDALSRVNLLSRTAAALWPAIDRLAASTHRPLRVLDLASGGGDVAVGLWRLARRAGRPMQILGLDMSPVAVERAGALAAAAGADVQFQVANVLGEPLPTNYDVICTSLFLHHLERADVVGLLGRMATATGRLVLVSDLRRSLAGYVLAQAVCQAITRSPVVHVDGPRSVAAAFTLAEMQAMCGEAGLPDAQLTRIWPWRFLLRWQKGINAAGS